VKLFWVLALAACAKHSDAPPMAPPWHMPVGSPLASGTQLVTAVVDNWTSTHAVMRAWQLDANGWKPTGPTWPAVIGKTGAAWGDGLHGDGAPSGRGGPAKLEGDGKSPAGAFALTEAFGYAPEAAHLPFRALDEDTRCIDDPSSQHYAEIGELGDRGDWKSAEKMHRGDDLYSLGVVVAHNPAHVAGAGSCIFLHVWSGPDSTTVGCTAMDKPQLAQLIHWLDGKPLFVLLPRDEYRALSEPWGLPPQ